MIALGRSSIKIHLALDPCDMRKSFNGLYDIACQHVDDNRLWREAIFVFTNKRRNRIKLLYFDGTGLFGWPPNDWRKAPSAGRNPANPARSASSSRRRRFRWCSMEWT